MCKLIATHYTYFVCYGFIFHSIIFFCVYSQYKVLFKVVQVASVIDKEMIGVKLYIFSIFEGKSLKVFFQEDPSNITLS